MANVTQIGRQGQHEEQAAEQVFSFGDPGHRFHPQRMDGEHGRHEGAGPEAAGHLPQNQEERESPRRRAAATLVK